MRTKAISECFAKVGTKKSHAILFNQVVAPRLASPFPPMPDKERSFAATVNTSEKPQNAQRPGVCSKRRGYTQNCAKKDASTPPVETMADHVCHHEVWIDLDLQEDTLYSCEGRTLKVPQKIVLSFLSTGPRKFFGFQAPNQVCFVINLSVALVS
jgi:hypothetical protein